MSKCGHLSVSALPSHIALLTMRSSLKQADSPARLQRHCAWWRAPLKYRRVIFCGGSRIIAGMILKKNGGKELSLSTSLPLSDSHSCTAFAVSVHVVAQFGVAAPLTLMHTESLQVRFLFLTNSEHYSPSAWRTAMTRTT